MIEKDYNDSFRPMLLEMPIRVNGYDIDMMGIVSNIVYVRWFEDLRVRFLDNYLPLEKMLEIDLSPMLRRTEVEYVNYLTIHDRPTGRIWMHDIGKTMWKACFEIATDDKIHCRGTQEGLIFNLKTKRPARMPAELSDSYYKALRELELAVN